MKQIKKIKFELHELGVDLPEIWKADLFDKKKVPARWGPIDLRLGPLFGYPCETCDSIKCSGHEGFIRLPVRNKSGIRNPLFGNVMDFISVLPLPSRKINIIDGDVMFDDTTLTYVTILNILKRFQGADIQSLPIPIWDDFLVVMQYYVNILFENRSKKIKRGSNQLLKGSIDRLKGKQGLIRRNCLGKRTNNMARAVFSPDPELGIDEVGVPKEFTKSLTTQDPFSLQLLSDPKYEYVIHIPTSRWFISDRFSLNDGNPSEFRLVRPIEDGDIVMVNRAPSLHRMSILAFWAKIQDTNTISLNPQVLACFNCDADGDAINIIAPSSEGAKRECKRIMLASKNIVSPRNGKNIIGPQQDYKLYCWYHNLP